MGVNDETPPACQALQTTHFLVTDLHDRSVHELEVEDIAEVDWNGFLTEVNNALVRVIAEGDMLSSTVRDIVRLILLGLRREAIEFVKCKELTDEVLPDSFWHRLAKALRLPSGVELRGREIKKQWALSKTCELTNARNTLNSARDRLSRQVDAMIVPLLLSESARYRELSAEIENMTGQITQMNRVLSYFKDLMDTIHKLRGGGTSFHSSDLATMQLRKSELRKAMPAMLRMATDLTGKALDNRYAALLTLESVIASIHREIEPKKQLLQIMRERRKQQIYGYSADDLPEPDAPEPKPQTVFITP